MISAKTDVDENAVIEELLAENAASKLLAEKKIEKDLLPTEFKTNLNIEEKKKIDSNFFWENQLLQYQIFYNKYNKKGNESSDRNLNIFDVGLKNNGHEEKSPFNIENFVIENYYLGKFAYFRFPSKEKHILNTDDDFKLFKDQYFEKAPGLNHNLDYTLKQEDLKEGLFNTPVPEPMQLIYNCFQVYEFSLAIVEKGLFHKIKDVENIGSPSNILNSCIKYYAENKKPTKEQNDKIKFEYKEKEEFDKFKKLYFKLKKISEESETDKPLLWVNTPEQIGIFNYYSSKFTESIKEFLIEFEKFYSKIHDKSKVISSIGGIIITKIYIQILFVVIFLIKFIEKNPKIFLVDADGKKLDNYDEDGIFSEENIKKITVNHGIKGILEKFIIITDVLKDEDEDKDKGKEYISIGKMDAMIDSFITKYGTRFLEFYLLKENKSKFVIENPNIIYIDGNFNFPIADRESLKYLNNFLNNIKEVAINQNKDTFIWGRTGNYKIDNEEQINKLLKGLFTWNKGSRSLLNFATGRLKRAGKSRKMSKRRGGKSRKMSKRKGRKSRKMSKRNKSRRY